MRQDPEAQPTVPQRPEAVPDAPQAPEATPSSRAERRALARATAAIREFSASDGQAKPKAAAFAAAAELRRVQGGGSGRFTPPARTRAAKAQRRARGRR